MNFGNLSSLPHGLLTVARQPFRAVHNSKTWTQRHLKDPYVRKAQESGLRARSAFKLEEIQNRYSFISSNSLVLDIGAAPGGWSIVVSRILGAKTDDCSEKIGKLISVDLLPMKPIPNADILQGDFQSPKIKETICSILGEGQKFNVILSDMLHNVTGAMIIISR